MSERKLSEKQKQEIEKIKKQWSSEMTELFKKWEEEEKNIREENPNAPRLLDKHLKQTVEIEKKYKERIRQVAKAE